MATVNSGGVEIFYEVLNAASSEVPIFFIAGLGGTRASCMAQAQPFSAERPVVIHDHRGTGESAKPLGVYTVENMAADIVAIMDDAGIDRAHMVGTSTGGAIIQVLCVDHGARVQSAAICCSWPKADHFFTRCFEMRKRVLETMGTETLTRMTTTVLNDPKYFTDNYDRIVEIENAMIAGAPPLDVALQRIDAIMAFDYLARLGEITTPVTVIGAKNDVVCPSYYSEQIAAAIPGAELKLFDDGGHFFNIARADEFNADVRDFISRNE